MVSISLDVPVEEGHLMQMGLQVKEFPARLNFPAWGFWSSQASLE
jgi:hypothetical protein